MTSSLVFAIPGYKRPKQVKACIESISQEIITEKSDAKIFISEHSDDEETWGVLNDLKDKYDFVETHLLKRDENHDYANNFRETFALSGGEWVWTFGNDDILLPGSLRKAQELMGLDVDFIHCAELVRTDNTDSIKSGSLFQLCSHLGWLDMTGFISCNMVRGKYLRKAAELSSWKFFSKNSFVHSCALLEALHDRPSLFVDMPFVASQNDPQNTEETAKVWEKHQVATRYFYVDEALRNMVDRGILPKAIDNVFFRYHSYFLWDRLISNMISDYSNFPDKPQTHLWHHVEGLANLLAEDQRGILKNRIQEVREMIEGHQQAMEAMFRCSTGLKILNDQHNQERFGWTYAGQPQSHPVDETVSPVGANGFTMMKWNAQQRQREMDVEILTSAGYLDPAKTLQANKLADFA